MKCIYRGKSLGKLLEMARLHCTEDFLVVNSGSKLKVISSSDPEKYEVLDLKSESVEENNKQEDLKKQKDGKSGVQASSESDPHVPNGRILTATFSKSGKLYAAVTDQKELIVFNTKPTWSKLWTRSVVKRVMSVTFDTSETALYVADRSGDVYRFTIEGETKEGVLVLGHVSMLIDVVVSPDDKYILTAERDEKIRVSHLPNAYNIQSYCLGHTEFVSRLALLPEENLLITGGGDSSLRLWDYVSGRELCKTSYDWAISSNDNHRKKKGVTTCIACSRRNRLVAITIFESSAVPVYQLTHTNGEWSFLEVTRIECSKPPWFVTFDPWGHLLILGPGEEKFLSVYNVEENNGSTQIFECSSKENPISKAVKLVNSDPDFFSDSMEVQSVFRDLHKVPVDNMPLYLERKKKRMEKTKGKKERRRDAQRRRKAQKRRTDNGENGDGDDDNNSAKRTLMENDDNSDNDDLDDEEEEEEEEQSDK